MYNKIVKELLSKVNVQDANTYADQKKYRVSDSFSTIEIYISTTNVSYRVQGDAYIIAMTKWLQLKLLEKEDLKGITVDCLIEVFALPKFKVRNATQILELIEIIDEV